MRRRCLIPYLVLGCVLVLALPVAAQETTANVPSLINQQGRIMLPDSGSVMPLPTGNYNFEFRIYDSLLGGNVVWGPQEFSSSNGQQVPVVDGYYNVLLGPADESSRPLRAAFADDARFLEITVSNNVTTVVIAPRQQIMSVPYVLKSEHGVPVGAIMPFAGPFNGLPEGWVLCNGANVNEATYPDLYAVIGTTWGVGGGSGGDFNLPDLRGYFARGAGGSNTGATLPQSIEEHSHGLAGHTHPASDSGDHLFGELSASGTSGSIDETSGSFNYNRQITSLSTSIALSGSGTTGLGVGGTTGGPSTADTGTSVTEQTGVLDNETRPENAYVVFMIKVR
jgi:microcystin-dependent protein